MDLDSTKRAADMIHDIQRQQADLMDRVRPVYHEPTPIYDRWGWLRRGESNVNINDRSNDWLPVALILGFLLLVLLWPRSEPQVRPIQIAPSPSSPLGTVSFWKQYPNGNKVLITSEPGKDLGNGQVQTPDGKVWTRNPDGTYSEVK